MLLPSDEVERQPEEGDHPQQVGPDVPRLSVNAKDRLETFPERRKCSYKFSQCLGVRFGSPNVFAH